jgi:hypothetical protein
MALKAVPGLPRMEGGPSLIGKNIVLSDEGLRRLQLNPIQEFSDPAAGPPGPGGNRIQGKNHCLPQHGKTMSLAGAWSTPGGRPATEA